MLPIDTVAATLCSPSSTTGSGAFIEPVNSSPVIGGVAVALVVTARAPDVPTTVPSVLDRFGLTVPTVNVAVTFCTLTVALSLVTTVATAPVATTLPKVLLRFAESVPIAPVADTLRRSSSTCGSIVPIAPVAVTLHSSFATFSFTVFMLPVALTPVSVLLLPTPREPIAPVADTLSRFSDMSISKPPTLTVSIAPVALTPDKATLGVTLPYLAEPCLPVPYRASEES